MKFSYVEGLATHIGPESCVTARKGAADLFRKLMVDELQKIRDYVGSDAWCRGKYEEAARLFDQISTGDYVEFLTLPAYDRIIIPFPSLG